MPITTQASIVCLLLLHTLHVHARVFQSDSGDHRLVGIIMEQQAGRGYCAPATMASVLNYHGIKSDQKTIAGDVGCSDDTGTDVEAMLDIISRSCAEYGLTIETLIGFDYLRYKRIIKQYNKLAKGSGEKKLWLSDSGALDLSKTFSNASLGILKKTASLQDLDIFFRWVRQGIDANTPLIWGVVLGIAPEPELSPYSKGGHLRLIIGYNEKTHEIIFSDPWGAGHKLKRMKIEDAYAITMSLHVLRRTPIEATRSPN